MKSRVALAAEVASFDTARGCIMTRSIDPISCIIRAFIAGAATAFAGGATIVGAYHYFGNRNPQEEPVDSLHVGHLSAANLIDARLVALAD